jgi:hypothetical protein
MSAFVVTRETINCCAHAWYDDDRRPACEELDSIGRQLWRMNADAVAERYQEPPEPTDDFRYRPALYSPVQQFKALSCLLYQCSEGDIDQRPLYKQLEERRNAFARAIVMDSKEYDGAHWDMPDKAPPAAKPAAKPSKPAAPSSPAVDPNF